jgi:hypothetical protein
MKKLLTFAISIATLATAPVMTGCNVGGGKQEPTPLVCTFESATVVAGPDIKCANFYEDYTAGDRYTGFSDATTGLRANFEGTVSVYNETTYKYWNGVAVSAFTDKTTQGLDNQCSVYGAGGNGGSGNFAVCYNGTIGFGDNKTEATFDHMWVTNATYTALSMLNGDSYGRKFTVEDEDFLLLTISAKDKNGDATGTSVPVYLADFRTATSPGVLTEWKKVDLTSLGSHVNSLVFTLTSNDNSVYGGVTSMNTPSYFCFDDVALFLSAE